MAKQETTAASILGTGTLEETGKNKFTVTDKHGNKVELKIKKVQAMVLQRVAGSIERPKRPTYTVELYGGSKQTYPLDEAAAKGFLEDGTDEGAGIWRQWQEYKQATDEAEAQYMERMMRVMFLQGVDFKLPDDQSFFSDDVFLGFEVPQEERYRKVHYLMNHLLDADVVGLMTKVMAATGVDEKVVADAEAAFRDSVREE